MEEAPPMANQVERDVGVFGRVGASPVSTSVQAMGEAACWAHLRSQDLGRLGVTLDGQPLVFPVNYAVNKQEIVFRTAPGTMLQRALGTRACFEIDHHDSGSREGWSVMAIGTLEDVTDSTDAHSQSLRGLPVRPLAPGPRPHWVVLRVSEVTGRHFTAGWLVPGNWLG
jgi:uncharacterized protein